MGLKPKPRINKYRLNLSVLGSDGVYGCNYWEWKGSAESCAEALEKRLFGKANPRTEERSNEIIKDNDRLTERVDCLERELKTARSEKTMLSQYNRNEECKRLEVERKLQGAREDLRLSRLDHTRSKEFIAELQQELADLEEAVVDFSVAVVVQTVAHLFAVGEHRPLGVVAIQVVVHVALGCFAGLCRGGRVPVAVPVGVRVPDPQ